MIQQSLWGSDLAFILDINDNEDFSIDILEGNGEHIRRCGIGHCDETNGVYSAITCLAPIPGYGDLNGFELAFNIVKAEPDNTFIDYTDGLETRFLDKHARNTVLAIICTCTHDLIDRARPSIVQMHTREPYLPEKAILKYHRIAQIFGQNGYRTGRGDPWKGHQTWFMKIREIDLDTAGSAL